MIGAADPSWAAVSTTRVSVSTAGVQTGALGSFHPTISGNGRLVVFVSAARHLVPHDTNHRPDVFVRDLVSHTTSRVSLTAAGGQVDGTSSNGQISADGRTVAFQTGATNVLARGRPDANGHFDDVFVRDRGRAATRLISRNQQNRQGTEGSTLWDISGTGRYVLFSTTSRNFFPLNTVGGGVFAEALYLRDVARKRTVWIRGSLSTNGILGGQVSDNGRYVAFSARSRGHRAADIVLDRRTGRKSRLTCTVVPCLGLAVDDLSASGRFVTMTTFRNSGATQVILYDRRSKTQSLVSVDGNGVPGNHRSIGSAVSGGGRFVIYVSSSTNLVPGDTNHALDVFRLNRASGAVSRVDLTAAGAEIPTGVGHFPDPPCQQDPRLFLGFYGLAISRDGSVVVFASGDGSVVAGDTNDACDIFARGDGL
jgi:Tol biopolymer transport system component